MPLRERIVKATHGTKTFLQDSPAEKAFANHLRETLSANEIQGLFSRYCEGISEYDFTMRRIIWKALAKKVGNGLRIGAGVKFKHLETFSFGKNVFIGDSVHLQGRHDGEAYFGDGCWIGPQTFIDARCLKISRKVGLGPSVRILGSTHTGLPIEKPVIETDLEIKPVFIGENADIGTGAIILPGVKIGEGAIVGAGAVVNRDIKPFEVVAGVPAKTIKKR
jgi:acetyltransferase-like isoleucine patch superfamily enzyme